MKNERKETMLSAEVEAILGVTRQHLNIYRKRGILRSIQYMPNGLHHYLREDVERLLSNGK